MQEDVFSRAAQRATQPERDESDADDVFARAARRASGGGQGRPSTLPPFSQSRAEVRREQGETGVNLNVDYESRFGVDPFTRGWASIVSDNPEELQLWAQRRYGPNAVILRGSAAGAQPGTPEYGTLYLSRDTDQPFEVFDPSQGLAAERAAGEQAGTVQGALRGAGGRAAEILAETAEVGTEFLPEAAGEALLTRGGGILPRSIRAATEIPGWRLRGLSRGAGYAGAAGGAAFGATALENAIQSGIGTNVESAQEVLDTAGGEAGFAAFLSALGSAAKFGGYLGIDSLIGASSQEGREFLEATRAINRQLEERARQSGMSSEELAAFMRENGIVEPLAGWTSNNPFARGMLGYLSRVSGEINAYRENLRTNLRRAAEREAADYGGQIAPEALTDALQNSYRQLEERVLAQGVDDSVEAGRQAFVYLDAFARETQEAASEMYDDAYARMAREGGDDFDVRYDFSALNEAISNGRGRRTISDEVIDPETGQPGLEREWRRESRRLTVDEQSNWTRFDRVAAEVDGYLRGSRRTQPETIIQLIQYINDELNEIGPDATGGGISALRQMKSALYDALDSVPRLNPQYSEETLGLYRQANDLYRRRAEMLDSAGVVALLRHGRDEDFASAAATLYNGNPSEIANVRRAIESVPNGQERFRALQNNYLSYALRSGRRGSALQNWNGLSPDQKDAMFTPLQQRQISAQLQEIDQLYNSTNLQSVIETGQTAADALDTLLASGRRSRAGLFRIRDTIEAARNQGNDAPYNAYKAGLWHHIMNRPGMIQRPSEGTPGINANRWQEVVAELDRAGALDILSPSDLEHLRAFGAASEGLRQASADMGAGIQRAQLAGQAANLTNIGGFVGALGEILSNKALSNAVIFMNPGIRRLEDSMSGRNEIGVLTQLTRMGYQAAADEGDLDSDEWREFTRALENAGRVEELSQRRRLQAL